MNKYIYTLSSSLFSRVFSLLCYAYAAKSFGVSFVGGYGVVFGLIVLSSFIGSIGINIIWPTLGLESESKKHVYFLFIFTSVSAALVAVVFCAANQAMPLVQNVLLKYMSISVASFSYQAINFAGLQMLIEGKNRSYYLSLLVQSICFSLPLLFSKPINNVYIGFVLTGFFCGVFSCFLLRKHRISELKEGLYFVKLIFGKGVFPYMGSASVQASSYYSLTLLAQMTGGAFIAGMFTLALQMRQAILFIPNSLGSLVLRDLSLHRDDIKYKNKIKKYHYCLCLVMLVGVAIISIGMYFYVNRFDVVFSIFIIVASGCLITVNNYYSRLASSLKLFKLSFVYDLFFSLVYIFILWATIKKFGLMGAASAYLLATVAQFITQVMFEKIKDEKWILKLM